ncbi:C39 family peptidase [Herbaspirillum sp. RTI4]|uniref:C39 family peptidase n=1 Tax=Herbaspirillum sp. RTI4 TaxID=3048640 RepID=UPI002AB5DADB|nr:C39 family peptidase [Herbaspirillum sp. RTI4]MDY7577388.1 C39 family peptidase [Herbaspirillum sp. RTI4]MEA9982384.1 C39 family peptidase [Herbaspirillum sp. RTI4]
MPLTKKIWIHAITLALQVNVYAVWGMEVAHINTLSTNGAISTRSWKTLRDFRVVKQSFDYSCGSSAIATILNQFYQQTVTELDILKAIDKGNSITSFDDMERAVPQFGFRAVGYAASFEQLTKLKIPVIVYLKYRGDDHFSVVRGINADTVWLADSSLGNRYLSRHQFLAMWGGKDSAKQNGKILVILADRSDLIESRDFFTINPKRPTALAISLQLQRNFFR